MDPQLIALLQFLLSNGMMGQSDLNLSMGQIPQSFDKYGNEETDVQEQARGANYLQDRNMLMGDLMTGAQTGAGGMDFSAFDPVIEDEPVQRPGEQKLQYYMSRNPGTVENLIANHIANGGTASSAYANVMSILNDDSEENAEMRSILQASIPQRRNTQSGLTEGPDDQFVLKLASDLEGAVAADPMGNYQDPETGQWYNRTEKPSEATEFFRSRGLPLPTDQYGQGDYSMDNTMGADWQQGRDAYDQQSQYADISMDAYRQQLKKANNPTPRATGNGTDRAAAALGNRLPEIEMRSFQDPAMSNFLAPYQEVGEGSMDLRSKYLANKAGMHANQREPRSRQASLQRPETQKPLADALLRAATGERERARGLRDQVFNPDYWRTRGQMEAAQMQGRTPLNDSLMARRMQLLAAGLPGRAIPG